MFLILCLHPITTLGSISSIAFSTGIDKFGIERNKGWYSLNPNLGIHSIDLKGGQREDNKGWLSYWPSLQLKQKNDPINSSLLSDIELDYHYYQVHFPFYSLNKALHFYTELQTHNRDFEIIPTETLPLTDRSGENQPFDEDDRYTFRYTRQRLELGLSLKDSLSTPANRGYLFMQRVQRPILLNNRDSNQNEAYLSGWQQMGIGTGKFSVNLGWNTLYSFSISKAELDISSDQSPISQLYSKDLKTTLIDLMIGIYYRQRIRQYFDWYFTSQYQLNAQLQNNFNAPTIQIDPILTYGFNFEMGLQWRFRN